MTTKTIPADPTYQLLPPLADDDFERLKASITERGVLVPVAVDEHGAIIDGHNRALIADSLGTPYPTERHAGLTDAEKRILAAELNVSRRHLTFEQKVLIGRKIEPDIAERARQRQGTRTDLEQTSATSVTEVQRTTDEVAKTVGIGSGRTYERAKRVIEAAEVEMDDLDIKAEVEAGRWTFRDVKRELERRRKREQERAVEEALKDAPMNQARRVAEARSAYLGAVAHARRHLLPVDATAAIASLSSDELTVASSFAGDLRHWLNGFEAAIAERMG